MRGKCRKGEHKVRLHREQFVGRAVPAKITSTKGGENMKQKRGISRYFLAMLLLLTIAVTASCGGGGGGGGDGGTPPAAGSTTGVWDSSTWDNATWGP